MQISYVCPNKCPSFTNRRTAGKDMTMRRGATRKMGPGLSALAIHRPAASRMTLSYGGALVYRALDGVDDVLVASTAAGGAPR